MIAKRQVEVALDHGADAVAHGCTGKGNDQVRFELTYKALGPNLQIIAPWREWKIFSREDAIIYAREHNVPIEQSKANIYSRDRNIWHLSHEGGRLEDPANAPEEAMWQWVASPEKAPDKPAEVEIGFEAGVPVSVDGKKLAPVALIETLNDVAAANGVGRIDLVENRLVGIKSRGAYETPGGTLLILAHRELEALCIDRETAHYQELLSLRYAELVYYGLWFTPLREALDAFFASTQQRVTGYYRPAALQRKRGFHPSEFTAFALPQRSRELRDDSLQPQRRRGFYQSLRAVRNCAAGGLHEVNSSLPTRSGGRMWSGRFDRGPDEIFDQFQRSFSFDRRLMPYEIAVDRAWAHAIEGAGILTSEEVRKTLTAA